MKKSILLIAVVILGVSCTRTSVLVKWADTFVYWKLDDVFDFTSAQSKPVKESVQRSVEKLKKEWLPQIGTNFRNHEAGLKKSFPSTDSAANEFISKIEKEIESLTHSGWQIIRPEIKGAAASLNWENWVSYKVAFEKQNRKILKDKKGKCEDRFEDQIEDWIGSLTDAQEDRIETFCKANTWPVDLRVKNRNHSLEWFEKQANISESTFSGENLFATLETWMKDLNQAALPEYIETKTRTHSALKAELQWFLLNLTEKQKKKFIERLGDRALEIEEI